MSPSSQPHSLSNSSHPFSSSTNHLRIESSSPISKPPLSSTEPFPSKHHKKWRWWHYLSVVVLFIGLLESFALSLGYNLLLEQSSPIRIELFLFSCATISFFTLSTF
ncbi:hypothetical protein BCR42DRAFT_172961 [Absidia repens]|uniref:Uncharacterized protein n=1 Tax=Absidia repens TaxID=90262 RepID=A0A1X2IV96_9FUNG|nr:hypothetical protein BCR42DRAFT_172961 [Absidia repens]